MCWSFTHLSTSSRVTMSRFFKALMAYSRPVFLNSASSTCLWKRHIKNIRDGCFFLLNSEEEGVIRYLSKVSSSQNWSIFKIFNLHPSEKQPCKQKRPCLILVHFIRQHLHEHLYTWLYLLQRRYGLILTFFCGVWTGRWVYGNLQRDKIYFCLF